MFRGLAINLSIRQIIRWQALVLAVAFTFCSPTNAELREPEWIWSDAHENGQVPFVTCHFRKTFYITKLKSSYVEIAADDAYELFVNGQKVASGESRKQLQRHNIGAHLRSGRNLVAVKVTNRTSEHAGLAARIHIDEGVGRQRVLVTDSTWRTNLKPLPLWHLPQYSDRRWPSAQSFGTYGSAEPWASSENNGGNSAQVTQSPSPSDSPPDSQDAKPNESGIAVEHPKFRLLNEFQVQHVIGSDGSLIAMAFNEFGEIVVSRENGPLMLVQDRNKNGVPDTARTYCDIVKNCQGILPLSGSIYVVGEGPDGLALYRLDDRNRDGLLESSETMVEFANGGVGEHGPHGLVLGPDGLIYITIGNHTVPKRSYSANSPVRDFYEGDLVGPRYEDPGGHAQGVKTPGGAIIRVDTQGKSVELVASGLRNAYDLAFNQDGELLTHDSDMESDVGTPWHRPTRVLHVISGAEFGWRSGWAKWPTYYPDCVPELINTGRGSPSGLIVYDHNVYPKSFQNALFTCDWAQGRIDVIRTSPNGATYSARRDLFLEGKPLNVTDIDVGPDGFIYFTTGGRGTQGNIYRVVYQQPQPQQNRKASGIAKAIGQSQLNSAWARQAVSTLRQRMGRSWDQEIRTYVLKTSNPPGYRTRALMLMHLVGPPPSVKLLSQLANDSQGAVRAASAYYLGLIDNNLAHDPLKRLMQDSVPRVRRLACEALVRNNGKVEFAEMSKLLVAHDRFEQWAARRLLERNSAENWHSLAFSSRDVRLFNQGATAMMISAPTLQLGQQVVSRALELGQDFVTDEDFVDMLRVIQLAIIRGGVGTNDVPILSAALAGEYPSRESAVDRELVRLLVALQVPSITHRYVQQLKSNIEPVDKVHLATHLRFLKNGWTPSQKLELLRYYDQQMQAGSSSNLPSLLEQISRDFASELNDEERSLVLSEGQSMPHAAVACLFGLPEDLDDDWVQRLIDLDQSIAKQQTKPHDRLRVGIVAALGQSSTPMAMHYLRTIYDRDPERRQEVAMSLAQHPDDRNWDYLVRSIPLLDGEMAKEVLTKLVTVDMAPNNVEHYRNVILCGMRLKESGADAALALLRHWSGENPADENATWKDALASWQQWYNSANPALPRAELPQETGQNQWTFHDLLGYLSSNEASSGSAPRGAVVYTKAQCAACHRYGTVGTAQGPDLTDVAKRFQKREILESIIYPSHVISDQYTSRRVVTEDGKAFSGLVLPGSDDEIVLLQSTGQRIVLKSSEVEEMVVSKTSIMPEGLLNGLSLREIGDLFAFLTTPPQTNRLTRLKTQASSQ